MRTVNGVLSVLVIRLWCLSIRLALWLWGWVLHNGLMLDLTTRRLDPRAKAILPKILDNLKYRQVLAEILSNEIGFCLESNCTSGMGGTGEHADTLHAGGPPRHDLN